MRHKPEQEGDITSGPGGVSIHVADSVEDLRSCFPVMVQLRQHLEEEEFLARAQRQRAESGYRITALESEGSVVAVAGYRVSECLAAGRYLYVDDLVTDRDHRSHGYGDTLFDWLVAEGARRGCVEIRLDSGVRRHQAHRFYFAERMHISSHHFTRELVP